MEHELNSTYGSRLPAIAAILLFALAAFFAGGVRAQTKVLVDNPSPSGLVQNEPSIVVKPWGDGNTLVASWQTIPTSPGNWYNGEMVHTSISTNGGQSWTDQSAISPLPSLNGDVNDIDAMNDAKLAYRKTGGATQLICAYAAWDIDNYLSTNCGEAYGIFVSYSGNDGSTWGNAVAVEDRATRTAQYSMSIRPCIAADNSSTSDKPAYLAWTNTPCPSCGGTTSQVRFATINEDGTITSPATIPNASSTSLSTLVDACDIAVDPNGTVFVLWEKRYTNITPNTRDLYISTTSDGGVTWSTYKVYSLSAPDPSTSSDVFLGNPSNINTEDYQDYPALTVSGWGTSEKVYVAVTAGTASSGTPIDFLLFRALASNLSSWSFVDVDAEDVASTTGEKNFDLQFQPTLCSNGTGGAFLLYYAQDMPATGEAVEMPVLYETDGNNLLLHRAISDPFAPFSNILSTAGTGVGDYIGIAYDPVQGIVHPIWTDENSSGTGLDVYSVPIVGGDLVGNLGFSNQRRAVMVGNTAHLAGFGELTPSTTINKRHAIWYNQHWQPLTEGTPYWTAPYRLELDTHPFDNYTNTSGSHSDDVIYGSTTPSIGVYQDRSTDYNAVAEVWAARPPASGYCSEIQWIYIRFKEWNSSTILYANLADWSPVDSIAVPDGAAAPVVAPLTAQIPGSMKDRYLIGWVVTYAGSGVLQSVTYLRGQQTGPEGSDPSVDVETQNESWGPHKGSWAGISLNPYSTLCNDGTYYRLSDGYGGIIHGSFVSVTSNESNGNGTGGPISDLTPATGSQTIVFTGDGTLPYSGVWEVNASYFTTGPTLGQLVLGGASVPYQLNAGDPTPPFGYYVTNAQGYLVWSYLPINYGFERNPSVTITSTGQKLTTWEEMDESAGTGGVPSYYSSIKIAKTIPGGTWDPTLDAITEDATDDTWSWLLNPSVTAFPKTPLNDVTKGTITNDQDPGAAELLYWQQNELSQTTGLETPVNNIVEQQFYESQGDSHITFTGAWHLVLPSWYPYNPLSNNNYVGANSQRSFGIYNTGPQYHTNSPLQLFVNASPDLTPYVHGLSYGIANTVSNPSSPSFSIQPTLTSPTPDYGAAKGTYDTTLGVQLYRSERRRKDSSMVTFKWGKVYVGDTSLGQPFREVMLHDGPVDSNGFVSHDAERDSIFATEWFDWPVSAEIKYDRLMLIPQAGELTFNIDTLSYYDTTGTQHNVYDTVAGAFIPDTSRRSDSAFFTRGTQIMYTVQLIHQSGHIDTIEQAIYNPSAGLFITPKTVFIDNAGYVADTVMLRVIGSLTNVPDADSDVQFEEETMLDTYPSDGDTTVAIATGGGLMPAPGPTFMAAGPYANPSRPSANNVSVLVHYPGAGTTITAQVYDYLGNAVGRASSKTSDAQAWDRIRIHAPGSRGIYYITVKAGNYFSTLGYSVY